MKNYSNSESRPVAVRFSNIKKQYRLGMVSGITVQEDLQSWWARIRGKEDPNLMIGDDGRLRGKSFMALNGIDLTIYQGEAVGIIGSNGAGKSTLLKLLSQVTAPTEGDIDIYGRVASLLEVGTGFHGEMSGRENVYMNGAILGMSRSEIDEVLDSIIAFSEVGDFIDTPVKRYSSGMYIRLAFAVAAHLKSEILVCDEVLAVGDMAFQTKCLDKMREAAETEGRTVLYVSHNMNTIRRLTSRCIVLDKGKVIYDGDTEEAIAVYMKRSLSENEVDIALSEKPRGFNSDFANVKMQRLLLKDKVIPNYRNEELMKFDLTVSAETEFVRTCLAMTFHTDSEIVIGTAFSDLYPLEKGIRSYSFSVPLCAIAKGTFYVTVAICQEDDIGTKWILDQVERAFRIEINGLPYWTTSTEGYVRLPQITLQK